jgi:hypothetical protein
MSHGQVSKAVTNIRPGVFQGKPAREFAGDSALKSVWEEFHFVDSAGVHRKIPPCTRI